MMCRKVNDQAHVIPQQVEGTSMRSVIYQTQVETTHGDKDFCRTVAELSHLSAVLS